MKKKGEKIHQNKKKKNERIKKNKNKNALK